MSVSHASSVTYRTALICATAMLTCIGLLSIYASSSIPAHQSGASEFVFFNKQAIAAIAGFFCIFILGHTSFRWIDRLTLPVFVVTIVLLCLVHVPGLEGRTKGASRWILLHGFTIQPGELAKLTLILFLAKNLSRPACNIQSFSQGILPNLVAFGVIGSLLMVQPDFGTTALLFVITFFMLFAAGLPQKYIYGLGATALVSLILAIIMAPYRFARLMTFLDPWREMKSGGFQIIQSYLGFQNGGLFGAGLGESRQKLFFLPEAHTDFILSVIGEELGLVGVLFICSLFAYLVYLGFKITTLQTLPHRRFLAFGLTLLISLQAILNMGVTMGMLPTKGITLPFVSNGANSLFVSLCCIAILARISQETPPPPTILKQTH